MFSRVRKLIAAAASVLLMATGFVALETAPASAALKGSMFDPGLIISDSVFYDFGTMTVEDIQRFLDSKVSACKDSDGGPRCIKDFVMNTPAIKGEDGRCESLPAKTAQSAAQIIYTVAQACKINPRVLIVTLQKEQGLIQASNPTQRMYDYALGMACPDTAAGCSKSAAGFFYQLYKGAGQLQWYGDPRGSFTYLKVGTNISRRYQDARVEKSKGIDCGARTFQLKSQATAALYYYTPYTPNQAALDNLYGTGDVCSAYGNRNFWRFYSDWFGSTIGGGFLLKSATSGTYLIVEDRKYLIEDDALVANLKPLGPLGTVSQQYIDSFKDSGELTPLVQSSTKKLYLVADGKKFEVADCNLAAELGLDCAKAVTLTTSQLSALKSGGISTAYVSGDGADRYFIDNGEIHEILDGPSLSAANIVLPAMSKLKIRSFSYLPWGAPIAANGSYFIDRSNKQPGVYLDGQFFRVDPDTLADIDFGRWFTPSAGSLSPSGLRAVESGVTLKPFVLDENAKRWLITNSGKTAISADDPIGEPDVVTPSTLLSAIPTVSGTIASPLFVKSPVQKGTFLARGEKVQLVASSVDRDLILPSLTQSSLLSLSASAFKQLTLGNPVYAIGQTLKSPADGATYVVNSYSKLIKLNNAALVSVLGLPAARKAKPEIISGYGKATFYNGLKIDCYGVVHVPYDGMLIPIDQDAVAHYPGNPVKFSTALCDQLQFDNQSLGRFVYVPSSKSYYLIDSGKKRLIASKATYLKLLGDQTPAREVDSAFAARISSGTAASSGSSSGGTSSGTSGSTVKYTVKSGDTLSAIASKYKVTLQSLMKANSITNANSLKVGQVLTIPKS